MADECVISGYSYRVVLPASGSLPDGYLITVTLVCNGVINVSDEFYYLDDLLLWANNVWSTFGDWTLSGNTLIVSESLCESASLSYQVISPPPLPENIPPVAYAGLDQRYDGSYFIVDASGSTDISGTIVAYLWTQISGTAATITSPTSALTSITGVTGVTVFQVKVTSSTGLWSTDTVVLENTTTANLAPIANAGANQSTTLSSITLDASGSYDPDGSIVSYAWTQISGTTVTITNASTVNPTITGMNTDGNYVFQVVVTDNGSLTATATVTITHTTDIDPTQGRMHVDTNTPSAPIFDLTGVTDVNINSNRKVRNDPVWLSLRNALLLQYTEAPDAGSLMAWSHVSAHVRLATSTSQTSLTHSGLQVVDGVACVAGDRIFDKDNATGSLRGIWVAAAGAWTRATDFDVNADVMTGLLIKCLPTSNNGTSQVGGNTNGGKTFQVTTANPIVIGTTALTFTEYSTTYSDGYDFDENEGIARGQNITTVNSGSYTGVLNNSCRGYTYWDEAVLDMQLLEGSKMVIVANMISPLIPYMATSRPLNFATVNVDRVVAEICYKISTCRAANVEIDSIQLGYENGTANDVYFQAYFDDYYNLCAKVIGILQAKYPTTIPSIQLLSGDTPSADVATGVANSWRTLNAPLNADVQIFRQYQQFDAFVVANFQQYLDRADEISTILNLYQSQAISTGLQAGWDQVELAPSESGLPYSVRQDTGEGVILSYLFMLMINENLSRSNIIRRFLLATSHLVSGTQNNIHPMYYFMLLGRNMFALGNYGKISTTFTNITGSSNLLAMPIAIQNNFIHVEFITASNRTKINNNPGFFTHALGEIIVLAAAYQTDGTDQLILDHLDHCDAFLNRIALVDHANFPNMYSARTTEVDTWIYIDAINLGGDTNPAVVAQVAAWLDSITASWLPVGGYARKVTMNPNADLYQKIAWQANLKLVEVYVVNFGGTDVTIPICDVNGVDSLFAIESYYSAVAETDSTAQHFQTPSTAMTTIRRYGLSKFTFSGINF